jgi:23S rRNA (uracil1939-C5)-methyltransferase
VDIVLASGSPRRRELMAEVAAEFRVFRAEVDESSVRESDPVKFAVEAAVLKARAAAEIFPSALVIGADTVVTVKGAILGKPRDRREAGSMLRTLSGRKHRVISGVALYNKNEDKLLTGYEITWVAFRELSETMIEEYLAREDYADKAGSYAIQDVGQKFVAGVQGDYDNVVGFPVRKVRRLLERFQAPEPEVIIEDVALPEGWGVARSEGRILFIPEASLGEKVRVRVIKDMTDYSLAQAVGRVEPSPFRTAPACPHFGECGGCLFQDLVYDRQLELKERHLLQTLKKIGRLEPDPSAVAAIRPSPALYGYRNKMEFAFGQEEGRVILGLRQRGLPFGRSQWRTIALAQCPIFSPVVGEIFPLFLDFARSGNFPAFDRRTAKGFLRNVVVREGKRSGQVMVILVTSDAAVEPDWEGLAARLLSESPRVKSFYRGISNQPSDVVQYESLRLLAGAPAIEETMAGLTFKIYPGTFFQPNPAAAEMLYGRIAQEAGLDPQSRVLGLYCGAGAIEIFLSSRAGRVTGIDSSPDNIAAAEENRALNKALNCRFLEGTVEKRLAALQDESFDVLVLDPPRSGLSEKAMRRTLALAIPTLVYVSCNPATLARDLSVFTRAGYRLERLAPFDFFPHTAHLEILTILRKA